jgi:hypothetical protein
MRTVENTRPAGYGRDLNWFLIAYLLMLIGTLMLVHVLQPESDGTASSSRSPVHQHQRV